MLELRVRDGGAGVTDHGLEHGVWDAVDAAGEGLGVGPVPDVQGSRPRPCFVVFWVWGGVGGDVAGSQVRDEGWVGGYVCYYIEEVGGAVRKDTAGGERLSGSEGAGEGTGVVEVCWGLRELLRVVVVALTGIEEGK